MRRIFVGLGTVLAASLAPAASAHDFFLLPVQFSDDARGPVAIQATVGSSFPKPETVVTADRVEQLTAMGNGEPTVRVAGAGPAALNLEVAGATPGLLVTGVGTKARDVDYAEDRIPLILGEYRVLPGAAAAVEALSKPRTWQVVSRRFAKTFVCVASCTDRSAADRSFGAHLEFVGSRSSADHFRLLAHGKPLTNYPIDLVGSDGARQHLTTDAQGDIHLPAGDRGAMMLFAAKLEPPTGAGRFTLDLTSLTFSRP
ncbi:DUF4198 domain-containing protein [Porphyrobacter sp. GA68]|uniref:DUF4198 domain-containing protein n=1 Tax=Porphyrobacter sp. GA68 TaxID=2883480 RepID=UPI001D197EEF|nr:DUF4198 domain-containing protein [Porphyrobacter sp. GA68]